MMHIRKLENRDLFSSNCYIVISGSEFAVIDPSVGYEDACRNIAGLDRITPLYVFLTHGHIDHMWEIYSYVAQGASVMVSSKDQKMLSDSNQNCALFLKGPISAYSGAVTPISDGDSIKLGEDFINVIATPGHTMGSVCYLAGNSVFTGDTLFAGHSYGRTDLPGGDHAKLSASLKRLSELSDDLLIYPGHGPSAGLGDSKIFI